MAPWPRALLAALPVLAVFALIGSRRAPAHLAAAAGALLSLALAVVAWSLPPSAALAAAAAGALWGLFPIAYIIFGSLLLYNLTVATGWAERLRDALGRVVEDRQLLLLLVGFGFVAFLDATAGFLIPVTVGTALLAGLGVPAAEAASYSLVASSLPPIFGAMGIPVLVLADVSGAPLGALARAQAATGAALFLLFPAWLALSFGGPGALRRLWLPALSGGLAYAAVLWLVATRMSLYPAALAASVSSLAAMALAGRYAGGRAVRGGLRRVAAAGWPYAVLMGAVLLWSLPPVARALGRLAVAVPLPGPTPAAWKLDLAASPGTAILVAAALVAGFSGAGREQLGRAARATGRQLRAPLASMLAMFALAQVMAASGMTQTLGRAVAGAGAAFPFVSPYLSWFGAAVAGSNTASNALLGRLQFVTAAHLGLDPVLATALAGAAAPLGKMAAPQVIAAAAAAGGLAGAEARLLRTGLAHGLLWTALIGAAGLAVLR